MLSNRVSLADIMDDSNLVQNNMERDEAEELLNQDTEDKQNEEE